MSFLWFGLWFVSGISAFWSPSYVFMTRQTYNGSWANGQRVCQEEWDSLDVADLGLPSLVAAQVHPVGHPTIGDVTSNNLWIDNHGPLLNTKGQVVLAMASLLYICSTSIVLDSPLLTVHQGDPGGVYWWGVGQTGCASPDCMCTADYSAANPSAIPCGDISRYQDATLEFNHYTLACFNQARFLCRVTVTMDNSVDDPSCD
jgi:hypothetical protein